jgi:mono/diheme cytochrome c family protein
MEFVMALEDAKAMGLKSKSIFGLNSTDPSGSFDHCGLICGVPARHALVDLPGIIGRSAFILKTFKTFFSGPLAKYSLDVRSFFVRWVFVGAMAVSGCASGVPDEPYLFAGAYVHHETVELGRRVYVRNCQACHGVDGDGRGPSSPGLSPAPRDLTAAIFRFAAVPPGYDLPRDEELMRVLDHGLQGTSMLAPDLQPTEKLAVLQYIKTFSAAWVDASKKVAPARTPTEDPYGSGSGVGIAAGERAYHGKAMCWSCHPAYVSDDAIGKYQISYGREPASTMRENMNRSVRMWPVPPDYTWDSVKISTSPEAVHRTLNNGLLGSGMPAYLGILEDEEMWAIAHYVTALVEGEIKSSAADGLLAETKGEKVVLELSASPKDVSEETVQTATEKIRGPEDLLSSYSCLSCHSVEAPTPGVGPSLFDVGLRLDRTALRQSINEPDATMSVGFEHLSGLMGSALNGNGFYQDVGEGELTAMVEYLAERKGQN